MGCSTIQQLIMNSILLTFVRSAGCSSDVLHAGVDNQSLNLHLHAVQ